VSLFDGISCGRVALDRAGIAVNSYSAFEIDKMAKAVSRYNYPDIRQCGDVLGADFTKFTGHDIVLGGSPCTFWSIAKAKHGREIDKDGVGWKLFMKYAEAVRVISPRFFIYENVASMHPNIRDYISEELGAEPIMINSALVSAQSRKRLYWTNIPHITQPDDKGIMLKDILISGLPYQEKSHCITATYDGAVFWNSITRRQRSMIAEPVRVGHFASGGQGNRIYSVHSKSVSFMAQGGGRGGKVGLYKVDLPDGDYIIRKLTPVEAERCQTLPDNYTAYGVCDNGRTKKISTTQRYKCVGNAWTVDVIAHILGFADCQNKNLYKSNGGNK